MELPIINKTYNCFDDGKISETRLMQVVIKEIIPFNDIDSYTKTLWLEELRECYWLFKKDTDYFLKGTLTIDENTTEEVVFASTFKLGWFSFGFWGGRLDVDGSLTNSLMLN